MVDHVPAVKASNFSEITKGTEVKTATPKLLVRMKMMLKVMKSKPKRSDISAGKTKRFFSALMSDWDGVGGRLNGLVLTEEQ